jgi:VanZ family protein
LRMVLRLGFWIALAFAIVMALLPQPPHMPGDPSDKVMHILAFAVLSGLGAAAYPMARLLWLGVKLSAVGALIEFAQMIPALHRDAQLSDWIADTGAIVIVLILASLVRARNGHATLSPKRDRGEKF